MNNYLNLILTASFCLLMLKGQSQTIQSSWTEMEIIINGNNSEWGELPRFFDNSTRMFYEVKNDKDNLYLIYQTKEKSIENDILTAGFEIEIQVKAKPKVNAIIKFPTLVQDPEPNQQSTEHKNIKNMRLSYCLQANSTFSKGFLNDNNFIRKDSTKNMLSYNFGWDRNESMIFELAIPLQNLFKKDLAFEKRKKKKIIITSRILPGEKIKKIRSDKSNSGSIATNTTSRAGGRMGAGGRSGIGGRGMGMTSTPVQTTREVTPKEQRFKFEIKLAKNIHN